MKQSFSLRGRLLFGTVLWTIGLVIMASAALIFAIESHHQERSFAFFVHDVFTRPLVMLFAVLAMIAGFLQVRRGVSPINNLRARLAGLHQGRDRRVDGTYPSEVQPLVNDLNALLENREQAVRRAVAKAGDLAHGLKTPLAILAHESERARAGGQIELAAASRTRSIEAEADRLAPRASRERRRPKRRQTYARSGSGDGSARALHSLPRSVGGD